LSSELAKLQDLRKTIRNAAILAVSLPLGWRRYVFLEKLSKNTQYLSALKHNNIFMFKVRFVGDTYM
jgi:hypothetical protein